MNERAGGDEELGRLEGRVALEDEAQDAQHLAQSLVSGHPQSAALVCTITKHKARSITRAPYCPFRSHQVRHEA